MRFYTMIPEDLCEDYEWIFMPMEESKLGNTDFSIAQQTLRVILGALNIAEPDVRSLLDDLQ